MKEKLLRSTALRCSMHVMRMGAVTSAEVFEDACMAMLLACGPKPTGLANPYSDNVRAARLHVANIVWLDAAEKFLTERYNVPVEYVGDFITAFNIWCSLEKEDQQNEDGNEGKQRDGNTL